MIKTSRNVNMNMDNKKMYITGEYLEKNPTWNVEDSPWKAKAILKIIKSNKFSVQLRSICEVGCGAGEILNQLYFQMPDDVFL